MVIAVLVNRFAPSSRGLKRAAKGSSSVLLQQQQQNPNNNNTNEASAAEADDAYRSVDDDNILLHHHHNHSSRPPSSKSTTATTTTTGHRRKPFRAMACLTSLASDLDVISDWFFYYETLSNDRAYREAQLLSRSTTDKNNNFYDDDDDYFHNDASTTSFSKTSPDYYSLIPPILMTLLLTSCIVGTVLWLILATDGRIITPLLRALGIDKLSMGLTLFLCVILEDIPQVVLTFLVEDYYYYYQEQQDGGSNKNLSSFAIMNVMTSLYDTLIKIAEAFDERNDMVETGAWCKLSVPSAHMDTVTAIVTLPRRRRSCGSGRDGSSSSSSTAVFSTDNAVVGVKSTTASPPPPPPQQISLLQQPESSALSLRDAVAGLVAPTAVPLPRLQFLTASLDGTVGLWETTSANGTTTTTKCVQSFGGGGDPDTALGGVTCLEIVVTETNTTAALINEKNENDDAPQNRQQKVQQQPTLFLAGYQNGTIKLWNKAETGECLRDFVVITVDGGTSNSNNSNGVSSVAVVSTTESSSFFVAGYQDGTARLWNFVSGECLGVYNEHLGSVSSVCALLGDNNDGRTAPTTTNRFVTGSEDGTLRLWDTSFALRFISCSLSSTTASSQASEINNNNNNIQTVPSDAFLKTPVPTDERMHMQNLVESSQQQPHQIRTSLKIFQGHTDSVLCVACLESSNLFVSGSLDCTARLWSVDSASCMRVFLGHSAPVTTITAIDEVTFLTGSRDASVKVWDAFRGVCCLRTYTGHAASVTALAAADDETTFVTSSEDRTIKLWVLTAVPSNKDPAVTLDQVLDVNDDLCRGLDPQ